MRVLMCEPRYYAVSYEINPWMDRSRQVDGERARRQWEALRDALLQWGAEILLIDPGEGWPDMVFTANAGLVQGRRVFLSRFRYPERQGERAYFKAWFVRAGYEIAGEDTGEPVAGDRELPCAGPAFEGQGDALFLGDTLFGAWGFRSDLAYYERIAAAGIKHIVCCRLTDPYFYHLDTCFCPLAGGRALWWPKAFSRDSQARMLEAADLWAVPQEEARRFACNAVVLGDRVVIPEGCPATSRRLEAWGYATRECAMGEFIKAGGACKCLALLL